MDPLGGLNWPNPDAIEHIKQKAYRYAEANITSAVIFGCHFRWDYLPYFTILHDYLAMVAEDYETDIDHKLDEMRFHRSRVNFINKVRPVGVTSRLCLRAKTQPQVYLPFSSEPAQVTCDRKTVRITLPEGCAYAIARFAT